MKNRALFKIMATGLAIIATCMIYFSCKKNTENDSPSNLKSFTITTKPYDLNNGALHFRSMRAADSLARLLNQLPRDQVAEWERKTGFVSQKTLYRQSAKEMDTATSLVGFRRVLERYADVLHVSDSMVTRGFLIQYANVCSRDGIFYAGDCLVKSGRDYLLTLRGGKPEDVDKYTGSDVSYSRDGVSFRKYKLVIERVVLETNEPKLKTGIYCGYGWYGPAIGKSCEYTEGRDYCLDFEMGIGKDEIRNVNDTCKVMTNYDFRISASAYKKRLFSGYYPYETQIWFKNLKFSAIYPSVVDNEPVQCESEFCQGVYVNCYDWDCFTVDTVFDYVEEYDIYLSVWDDLGIPIINPLSPHMITDEPKFLKVHGEASHQYMDGIHAVISYGYGGTQGVWCEQQ